MRSCIIRVSSYWSPTTENPPAIETPITYYGTLNTFTQTAGYFAPNATNAFNVNAKTSRNYNGSFGVQQDLGHSILLDVSYATVLGRDIQQSRNINTVSYGAKFLPQHQDPTTGKPLADIFFEPYPGYSTLTYYDDAYTSSYHALLAGLTRRFSHGFPMGVSYAFSKHMDFTGIPQYATLRAYAYGLDSNDQTHNMTINYTYNLPNVSNLVKNKAIGYALDHWVLSGISQFATGTPAAISFTTTNSENLNGGGDAQRVDVVGDASSRETFTNFPSGSIRPPSPCRE